MNNRINQLKKEWDDREKRLGQTKRAVLFKRFPAWLNNHIHKQHVRFVVQNIPQHANQLLDVGCGYGRISKEIKHHHPLLSFTGIELCTEFAAAYEREIGPCFNGAIQDFQPNKHYDVIIIVTLLMYLDGEEHQAIINKLWSILAPGGMMICIEPAIEFLNLWRRLTRTQFASPTGGSVYHFTQPELQGLFTQFDDAELKNSMSVHLLPFLRSTILHHGVAVSKVHSL